MRCTRNCVISEISTTPEVVDDNSVEATTNSVTFWLNSFKLHDPVVTLAINDNIRFLEHLKQVFRRTVSLNKCRSEIRTEPINNSLDCMIDPIFRNFNILFHLSFRNGDELIYYMTLVEIKYFNALIDNTKKNQEIWNTYQNVKKQWLYNKKCIRWLLSTKLL